MYNELVKRLRERAEAFDYDDWVEARDYEKAANVIELLSAECDAYRKVMTDEHNRAAKLVWDKEHCWIPVTERLPEKYHQVLCYGTNGILIDYYSGETSVFGKPLFMVSEERVSHWMYLPQPPKEEK